MTKNRRARRVLKTLAVGCGSIVLLAAAFLLWVGADIYRATRPFEPSEHHPFRSQAKKERYLAFYDARAADWPVAAETRTVETSWGSTFVRISGPVDGPPLVLLPGANATSLMWEPNIEGLSREHRVYAVDNIVDFGRSINTRPVTTPSDYVSWLDELFDVLGFSDDLRLVGMSYGGWIASQYALEHPDRLHKLVLIAPAATVAWFSQDFLTKGLLCIIPLKRFMREMTEWALADLAAGDESDRELFEEALDNGWLGLRCFEPRQMVAPTVLSDEQWRALRPRTLFMVGEDEVIYEISASEAVARLDAVAPQIETDLVPDCSHGLTWSRPDRVNRKVLEFLAAQ